MTEDFQEKSAPKTDGEYQHDKGRVHNRAETINNSTMIKSLRTGTSTDHGLVILLYSLVIIPRIVLITPLLFAMYSPEIFMILESSWSEEEKIR